MQNRRIYRLLLVTLLFSACSPGQPTERPDPAPFDWRRYEGAEIVFLANQHPWVDLVATRLNEFRDLTGIAVTLQTYPEDQFRTKRTVEFTSRVSAIDVYMIMPGNSVRSYAARGWMEPLDPFLTDPESTAPQFDVDDFNPLAWQAGRLNEDRFTIPILQETSLIAFNRAILEEFGMEPPDTMEDLERVARTVFDLSNGEIYGITMRGNAAAATSQWSGFLHSFGGSWVDSAENPRLAQLHQSEAIAALSFYGDILRLYGPPTATRNNWYESTSLFADGQAAMIYDANVFRDTYENAERSAIHEDVGYAMIPAGPGGRRPHVSHWSLAIYADSREKGAAWHFIQWATGKELAEAAQRSGVPSARTSAWNALESSASIASREWRQVSLQSYQVGTPLWNPPVQDVERARDIVGRAIVEAILGHDVSDAAATASRELQHLLDSERN